MKQRIKWIGFAMIFTMFVRFGLPALELLLPEKFIQEVQKRDIESSALFYTDSDEAIEANFRLIKD